jgi:hypothetical protein
MTVFVSDTFTDTDGVLLENHAPETGGAWLRRLGFSSVQIDSNAIEPTGSGWIFYTNSEAPGGNEYEVQLDVTTSGVQGLLVRFVDLSNYYNVYLFDALNQWVLIKRVGGTSTQIASLIEAAPATPYEMKLECLTATKKLYVDDVEKMSTADDELQDTGLAGLVAGNFAPTKIDNFIANDVGGPVSENASMQPIHHWWPR